MFVINSKQNICIITEHSLNAFQKNLSTWIMDLIKIHRNRKYHLNEFISKEEKLGWMLCNVYNVYTYIYYKFTIAVYIICHARGLEI